MNLLTILFIIGVGILLIACGLALIALSPPFDSLNVHPKHYKGD